MKTGEIWTHIHAERADMADTWSGLTAEQWAAPSWCHGWSVQDTAGHILAAAEQTPLHFYKELAAAGFRFNVFTDRGAKRLAALSPDELVQRLRARSTTTNHPPAPVIAMLGEIIVHGEDIRRPLGLAPPVPRSGPGRSGGQLQEDEHPDRVEASDRRPPSPGHRLRLDIRRGSRALRTPRLVDPGHGGPK